jgi:hypothetical protein
MAELAQLGASRFFSFSRHLSCTIVILRFAAFCIALALTSSGHASAAYHISVSFVSDHVGMKNAALD